MKDNLQYRENFRSIQALINRFKGSGFRFTGNSAKRICRHELVYKSTQLSLPLTDYRFAYSGVRVIIPTLNEDKNIKDILLRLQSLGFFDILVVDGHSTDSTVKYAESMGAKVLLQNGHGKGAALREAFLECLDSDITVMIDADGSMSPEELPSYIEEIMSGADLVKGSRFLPIGGSEDLSVLRRFGNTLMTMSINFLFQTHYTDLCYGYMAFSNKGLRTLCSELEGVEFEIEAEICVKAKTLGLKVKEVPSFESVRRFGVSNLHAFQDGFKIMSVLIRQFFLVSN